MSICQRIFEFYPEIKGIFLNQKYFWSKRTRFLMFFVTC